METPKQAYQIAHLTEQDVRALSKLEKDFQKESGLQNAVLIAYDNKTPPQNHES